VRILISSGDYYPNLGGATSLFGDITLMLMKSGHSVTVLTRQWPGMTSSEQWNGCQILRLDYPMLFEQLIVHRQFVLRSPLILWRVLRLLRTRRIETVCIGLLDLSAIYLLLLRPLLRFRLILYLHGSETRVLSRTNPTYEWLLKWTLRAADAVVAVSEELAREAAGYVPSAESKIRVIHNGVDVEALNRAAPHVHVRPYIAFVGRLVYEKDVDTLIEAFQLACRKIEGVDLLIAGTGRGEAQLKAKAAVGGGAGRIRFLGRLEREACYSLVKGALFIVLPSRTEGHPIVAVEARVAGKPLLGSQIPGIARLVEEGRTGVLFRQGDAAELAGLIEKYCQDDAALAALAAGARDSPCAEFDLANLMPQHLAVFDGAVKS
jgi:glycosyltransferase involved in cell wall biosynthesis